MPADFAEHYGPWALITGGSDGTGEAFARQLAERGLNLVLIARRPEPLQRLAEALRAEHGVEVRTASIDLYQADAGQRVIETTRGLDVGLFVSNAGSDTNGTAFLDAPYAAWSDLLNRNIAALVEPTYHLAAAMKTRGRGGIIVMSSGAALGGQPGGAIYSATKSFSLNFAESLWSELEDCGVHVLCAVCSAMNTPSLNRLLGERNLNIPELDEPDAVVGLLLDKLGSVPVHIFPFGDNQTQMAQLEEERRQRLSAMQEMSKLFYGET